MKAAALHPDVIVVTSRAYATSCALVRHGNEAFVVDSPVFPDELEILPTLAAQAEFNVVGRLATHADWDHVLAGYAFPDVPLGVAESTEDRLLSASGVGDAQRGMRDFDDELYVTRPGPLALASPQPLPVPGKCGIGEEELELHPATGHTADGMAIVAPWANVLICGDYLSPVEIPMLSPGGSLAAYLDTLATLEPLVEAAAWVVPGHGGPVDAERAAAILREDRAYLEALRERGAEAALPLARRTPAQRTVHLANVERLAA